mgnify:CR=1 FL=1
MIARGSGTRLTPYLYLVPLLAGTLAFTLIPAIYNIYISFTNWSMFHFRNFRFIGLDNYREIFSGGGAFGPVIGWTFTWAILCTALNMLVGLVLALLLNHPRLRERNLYRTLLVIPWGLPFILTVQMWAGLLNVDGAVNLLLTTLGLERVRWLTHPFWARVSVVLVNLWLSYPFFMVVFLAALQSIPRELYEAARIDGAGPWGCFAHITFPWLGLATLPLAITQFAFQFNNFGVIYLLTGGGPKAGLGADQVHGGHHHAVQARAVPPGVGIRIYVAGSYQTNWTAFCAAAMLGEIWHPALPWLQGDQLDSVTNYPFREACLAFFARGELDAAGFWQALEALRMAYPEPVHDVLVNLLGSHDVARWLTECGGGLARAGEEAPGAAADPAARARAALGAAFLLTYTGVPLVYYGDELGLVGGGDPDCRRCMPWAWLEEEDPAATRMLRWYQGLIRLRRERVPLRRGGVRGILADPVTNVLAFVRDLSPELPAEAGGARREKVVVVLNRSARERRVHLPLAGPWRLRFGPVNVDGEAPQTPFVAISPPGGSPPAPPGEGSAPPGVALVLPPYGVCVLEAG